MENNTNIDELVIRTITENLQNIDQKLKALEEKSINNSNAELYKDLHRMSQTFNDMNKNVEQQHEYLKILIKKDNSTLFTETKEKIAQFSIEFNNLITEIRIPLKQKFIALSIISILAIAFTISIFQNIQMMKQLEPAQKNDLKYRFMESLGDDKLINATLYTDSIFNKFTYESIKKNVEKQEELIRKKAEADLRAKYAEQEAYKLRIEADKLEKQTE